ncbi:membrane protein [alpha proteobacterium U9-1i]|nr:membrane protein [alpha proteobacterium U9-1i]
MFGQVASFELRYQLKSPVLWITFLLFFLMGFIATTGDTLQIGAVGNAHKNSPFAITQTIGIMAVFAQFAVVAFVANVVIRDWETGFGPILHATRIKKFDYLFGRFVGAFIASLIVLLAIPLSMMIGSLMPWLDPERFGPFVLWHYVYGFLIAGAPTLLMCAALFFALATATRSIMASYLGLIGFLVLYVVMSAMFNRPQHEEMTALLEPYGLGALFQETRYWTASDRNTQLIPISETYLANRAIWGAVSVAALVAAYFMFSFSTRAAKLARKEKPEAETPIATTLAAPSRRNFGFATALRQVWARARFEAAYVLTSPAFIVLMGVGLFNAGGSLWFADEGGPGSTTIYPVTLVMAQTLLGSFTIIPVIIATYYAGELVWRDREKRLHEIVDSTPAPDWTFVTPKVLALLIVLAASIGVSVAAAVLVQALKGFTQFNLHEYFFWYAAPSLVFCFAIAALAVFFQAISPHKFIGWGLMIVYLIVTMVAGQMGFDHNIYIYAGYPNSPLSEMNDQGHYWIGAAWFQAYWSIFALLLVVLAYSLWRRGGDTRLMPRLRMLPRRLSGVAGAFAGLLVLAFAGVGGWIYYNTNVLNDYRSNLAGERWQADMERALLQYETAPQPKVTDVTLRVDLYPSEHRAEAQGAYQIENRTGAPLTQIHLLWPQDLELVNVEIDGATVERDFADETPSFPFQIWTLSQPMQPGERREIRFSTRYGYEGFRNSNVLTQINDNGSFINDRALAPLMGFDRGSLLQDRNLRRKYGLPEDLRMARLEDETARGFNYLRHDADWVNADITVSTDAGQTPIAPGYTVSDETANGRRTVHFRTDAPILHFFSIQSAHYEIARDNWNDVALEVYYDRRHEYNIERMMRAMKVSFDVFTREFSPYQFRQMRILEFPGYATFAQAFANTVPYSEAIGFIARFDDAQAARETDRIDYVTYVTAHEVAHQWWAHQLIGGDQQGSTMLSETFASYSALLVMEEILGPDQVRRFLRYELDNYLRSRGGEVVEELPLNRVENQGYIHYRKGGVVMYFLRSEVGEDVVNRSMQRLLTDFSFRGAPYPRSSDFLRILREEAGPEHDALITDLFERITLYDARVVEASTARRADGRWDVSMVVEARKLYADGEGAETEAPLAEAFEIGVFNAEPGEGAFSSEDVIAMERRPIRRGRQTIELIVDREPRFAGIDPYNKRIDRNSDDNVQAVSAAAASPPS